MALCPFAVQRPVGNHGGVMKGHLGLVLHVQQGNGSLAGYFNDPASQVSSHFWCSKDGPLEQYVDTNTVAWAQAAGNPNYLSVETEGFDTEPLTAAQIASVASLLAWASQTYQFPIQGPVAHGQRGLTPHCNPDGTPDPTWGNHPCPGSIRLGQMPAIIALAKPVPPTPPPIAMTGVEMASEAIAAFESANDGNRHVFVPSETSDNTWHWWQNMKGEPSYAWNCEELIAAKT